MIRRRILLGALLAVLFTLGWWAGRGRASGGLYSNLDLFVEVLQAVQANYVDPVEPDKLVTGAMRGVAHGLDPWSRYLDPEEFRARMEELSEQMQSSQRVAWADNAIRLAVEMTVASIGRLELSGSSDEQAQQVRDAIRVLFPEAVTLVREAREGLA